MAGGGASPSSQGVHSLPVGVGLAILSCFAIASGNCLFWCATVAGIWYTGIRMSHVKYGDRVFKSAMWWISMIVAMGIGELLNFAALGLAPATVVSPLGAFTIPFTAILAKWKLGEPVGRKGWLGTLLVFVGGACVVLSAPSEEGEEDSLANLARSIGNPSFIWFLMLLTILAFFTGLSRGLLPIVGSMCIFGVFCTLSVKAVSGGIFALGAGHSIADHEELFAGAFVVMAGLIALQSIYFNIATMRFSAAKIVPLHYAGMQSLLVVGAALLYDEMTGIMLPLFVPGVVMSALGSFLVHSANVAANQPSPRSPGGSPKRGPTVDEEAGSPVKYESRDTASPGRLVLPFEMPVSPDKHGHGMVDGSASCESSPHPSEMKRRSLESAVNRTRA